MTRTENIFVKCDVKSYRVVRVDIDKGDVVNMTPSSTIIQAESSGEARAKYNTSLAAQK